MCLLFLIIKVLYLYVFYRFIIKIVFRYVIIENIFYPTEILKTILFFCVLNSYYSITFIYEAYKYIPIYNEFIQYILQIYRELKLYILFILNLFKIFFE